MEHGVVIDLLTASDEQEIADTIGRMLSEHFPLSRFRVAAEDRPGADRTILPRLAELGAQGLGIGEEGGGLGLGFAVEALVFREYGRCLLSPKVLGTIGAARLAGVERDQRLIDDIVTGRIGAGVAIAREMGDDGRLQGTLRLFDSGEHGFFVAWGPAGAGLYRLAPGECHDTRGLDETLAMQTAHVADLRPLAWSGASSHVDHFVMELFAAAMMAGMAEAVREMAVAYAKEREQFGKPIGHFQAVKHKCADMALHAEAAWCETVYAALDLENGGAGAPFHVLNAKSLSAGALLRSAKDNIQIHGGMGYTTEVAAHHFVKRGRVMNELGHSPRDIRARLLKLPFVS